MRAVLVVVAALAVVVVTVWRWRARRQRRRREPARATDRRLVVPPPSPYMPSRGFRLLDAEEDPPARPPVERPRLEPHQSYVFGESPSADDDVVNSEARHSNDWFLSRSAHRSPLSRFARRLAVGVAFVVVVVVVVTYYLDRHSVHVPAPGAPRAMAATSALTPPRPTAPLRPRRAVTLMGATYWAMVSDA